jgi:plasmid stabilization system protein ParE
VRRVRFTPAARAELIEAQDWYERAASGLGFRFLTEIDRVAQRMADAPLQFALAYKAVRRARVKVFPYALFFVIDDDALLVIACFHSRRNPKRWQSRA